LHQLRCAGHFAYSTVQRGCCANVSGCLGLDSKVRCYSYVATAEHALAAAVVAR
jgi:hypothetical protein